MEGGPGNDVSILGSPFCAAFPRQGQVGKAESGIIHLPHSCESFE